MMTLLRHFTQQLNQICLYGDSTSIGQGQPIPQTRRCRQKMLFSDVFRQARFLSSHICLHKGVWAGKLHENKGVLDQKAHFCLQEFTWFLLLQLSSSRLWGQLLAWHMVQVYLRESSNRITEKKKILRMQCMKEKCSLRIALTINDLLLCLVDLLAHLSEDLLFHHLAMIILLDHKLHKGLNTKWKSEH